MKITDLLFDKKSRIVRELLTGCLLICVVLSGCGRKEAQLVIEGVPAAEAYDPVLPEEEPRNTPENRMIYIYVCGAVVNPGVVELTEGSRADEAVQAAGGFAQDADISYVNLAARVSDGEKLLIPTMDEAQALIREAESRTNGLININQADLSELCTLSGIGESRAYDIIAYRESGGGFQTIEEIMNVSGIKENTFNKIKDKITVE